MSFDFRASLSWFTYRAGCLAVVLIALLAPASGGGDQDVAQRSPRPTASPVPPLPDSGSVIELLDSVHAWYRGVDLEYTMVDEPSEVVLFVRQDRSRANDWVKLAFEYARAEAGALASLSPAENKRPAAAASGDLLANPSLLQDRQKDVRAQIAASQDRINQLQKEIATLSRGKRDKLKFDQLRAALSASQDRLDFARARAEFLDTMAQFEGSEESGRANRSQTLLGQIDEIQRTFVPIAENDSLSAQVNPSAKADQERSGLIVHARRWFELRHKIDLVADRWQSTYRLRATIGQAADALRRNIAKIESDARTLAGEAEVGDKPATIEARRKEFEGLINRHKTVVGALAPLPKMWVVLGDYLANLDAWRDDARQDAADELYSFALSAAGLMTVLAFLVAVGIAWQRIAFRYVEDKRRRNQIRRARNVVIGVLIAIVLAFEFVSEAGSLVTVIGLGTAGIAVALQDVILSIAGYFRIGGRFGIKVGDWVELQGVRGEVVDIGLTKLTMMELGGEGGEREPTGRLVVMPNSVVFREKFANRAFGHSLGWDEIELTVSPDCDYKLAEKRLLETVEKVFSQYSDAAQGGSREMGRRLHLELEPPRPQSRLRISSDAIRLCVRYPVDVRMRAKIADEISRRLLETLKHEPAIRLVPQVSGAIRAGEIPAGGSAEANEPAPARAASQTAKR